jgi:hypothetical protein
MKLELTGTGVRLDVTDAEAGTLGVHGRKAQTEFVQRLAGALVNRPLDAEDVFLLRGKRGVSNRGFMALVATKEGT